MIMLTMRIGPMILEEDVPAEEGSGNRVGTKSGCERRFLARRQVNKFHA